MAMLIPALSMAKEMGKRILCAGNQRQIAIASISYALDFNDRLYSKPYDSGGYNRLTSWPQGFQNKGRRDCEFSYLVTEYLHIKLSMTWDAYKWATPKSRANVLYCPSMKLPCDTPKFASLLKYTHFSYAMVAVAHVDSPDYDTYSHYATRYSKLGNIVMSIKGAGYTNIKNVEKIFFGDMVNPDVKFDGNGNPFYWMNHGFQGGNFAYPDGRVEWTPRSDLHKAGIPGMSYTQNFHFPSNKLIFGELSSTGGGQMTLKGWDSSTKNYIIVGRPIGGTLFRQFY